MKSFLRFFRSSSFANRRKKRETVIQVTRDGKTRAFYGTRVKVRAGSTSSNIPRATDTTSECRDRSARLFFFFSSSRNRSDRWRRKQRPVRNVSFTERALSLLWFVSSDAGSANELTTRRIGLTVDGMAWNDDGVRRIEAAESGSVGMPCSRVRGPRRPSGRLMLTRCPSPSSKNKRRENSFESYGFREDPSTRVATPSLDMGWLVRPRPGRYPPAGWFNRSSINVSVGRLVVVSSKLRRTPSIFVRNFSSFTCFWGNVAQGLKD